MEDAHLRHLAAARKLPRDWREDVVQESWVDIVKNLRGFQGVGAADKLLVWMSKVVRSKAVSLMRRLARQRFESLEALSPESPGLAVADGTDSGEWRELLVTRLAEVPTTCWLLLGHFLDGRPVKELADEAGLTRAAASCRIRRGIRMLRRPLSEEFEKGQ